MTEPVIRDAATIVLARRMPDGPQVLMGQRGFRAAFLPGKFVFPGGAVDSGDTDVILAQPLQRKCQARLLANAPHGPAPEALAVAAIRELWEEAGLVLGTPAPWPDPPQVWQGFADTGHRPSAHSLQFVFRAVTPPGNPRRFDARFFLADARHLSGNPDDFSRASDELSNLQWVPLTEIRIFDLPFVTEIVLAMVASLLAGRSAPASVPFFDNSTDVPTFRQL